MGSYATHSDTIHPTQAWELAEYCTACHNTGWVEYPKTLLEIELDPCPHGCEDMEILLEEGQQFAIDTGHHDQWLALQDEEYQALPEDLEAAHGMIKHEYQIQEKDPFLTLSQQFKLRGYKRYESVPARHQGAITSDKPIWARLNDSWGRIPPHLVGQVMHMDKWETTVRYEFAGSYVDMEIDTDIVLTLMRFAYSWDDNYSTASLMG